MATIGGHGYGAKVATMTANSNLNRFTGVILLDGGPLDHRYYDAYQQLASYVERARNAKIEDSDSSAAIKKITDGIPDPKWRSIFL